LKFVFDAARTANLRAIPVTGINRTSDYQNAAKEANDIDHFGVCLRLENEDLSDPDLHTKVDDLVGFFGEFAHNMDLVVDFGAVSDSIANALLFAASSIIANLPGVRDWRTLTFAATGFPQDLGGVEPRTVKAIQRTEWTLWQNLAARRSRLIRLPSFGDYGIAHPIPNEIDPRLMKMSAQLRYTSDDTWLVFKARNVKDYGYEQFNGICRNLVGRSEYKGAPFSWGDNQISVCATPGAPSGNATTWRRIGTNHHLTFVVDQLASVPGL